MNLSKAMKFKGDVLLTKSTKVEGVIVLTEGVSKGTDQG